MAKKKRTKDLPDAGIEPCARLPGWSVDHPDDCCPCRCDSLVDSPASRRDQANGAAVTTRIEAEEARTTDENRPDLRRQTTTAQPSLPLPFDSAMLQAHRLWCGAMSSIGQSQWQCGLLPCIPSAAAQAVDESAQAPSATRNSEHAGRACGRRGCATATVTVTAAATAARCCGAADLCADSRRWTHPPAQRTAA